MGGFCGAGIPRGRQERAASEQQKKAQKSFNKEAPQSLPVIRKRALTIPLAKGNTHFWERKQKTSDQLQSLFFGRLPLEVRDLVYRFYLTPDGLPLHLFRRTDKRLGHCFCTFGPESHSHMPQVEWGYQDLSRTRAWRVYDNPRPPYSNHLLPLLKTCRRAYSEGLPILYTSNTFCFQDITTLRYFAGTVLPQRLRQINAIQLPWMKTYLGFHHPNGELSQVLEALDQMTDLQEIHVVALATQPVSRQDWQYPAWTDWVSLVKWKYRNVSITGAPDIPSWSPAHVW
ncbi:MAG: hypothetical protein Q9166_007310 [cf. Caloplaca sp. 2 TL-2023]